MSAAPTAFLLRYRLRVLLLRGGLALGSAAALFGSAALAAYLAELGEPLPPLAKAALALVVLAMVLVVAGRQAWLARAELSARRAARAVEVWSGVLFHNELVTSVELAEGDEAARLGYSPGLLAACAASAEAKVATVSLARVVPLGPALRLLLVAALALAPLAVLAWRYPAEVEALARAYLASLVGGPGEQSVRLVLRPGDLTVPQGAPVDFEVLVEGPGRYRYPQIRLSFPGAPPRVVELASQNSHYRGRLDRARSSFRYRAESGSLRSTEFAVTVVEPPRLEAPSLRFTYPEYTGQAPEVVNGGRLDVRAPPGTVVELSARLTAPATSGEVLYSGGEREPLEVAGLKVSGFVRPERRGEYRVVLRDAHGFTDPDAVPWRIEPVPDRVPRVFVLEPQGDLSLAPQEAMTAIPVQAYFEDDFGVGGARLAWKLRQRVEYTYQETERSVDLPLPGTPTKLTTATVLDLTESVLQPGDVVAWRVEAWDRAPGTREERTGRSREYEIRIPYKSEAFAEVAAEQDSELRSLADVAEQQKKLDRRVDEVLDRVKRQGDMSWRERQEAEKIAAQQKAVRQKAQELAARMQQTIDKAADKDVLDTSTLSKLQEVQRLVSQVADQRMKEMMARLQEMMRQSTFDARQLDELRKKFDKERYAKQLDQMLSALKKLRAEQELDRSVERAKELVQRQEALARETLARADQKKDAQDLAEGQEKLAEATAEHAKRLEAAAKEVQEQLPEAAELMQREAQQLQGTGSAQEDQQKAGEQLEGNQPSEAQKSQQSALNKLRASLDQLQETKSKLQKKEAQVSLQGLVTLAHAGVDVAAYAAKVAAGETTGLDGPTPVRPLGEPGPLDRPGALGGGLFEPEGPERLASSRAAARASDLVRRGAVAFERRFEKLFSDEIMVKAAFLAAVGELVAGLDETKDAFEQTRWFSGVRLARQQQGRAQLLVLGLLQLVKQLKDSAQQQGQSSFMDMLDQLVKRQEQLNEQTRRQGQRPQNDPMLQQLMQQLAAEQAMVRESLERLGEQSDEARKLEEQFKELSKQMREVEEALAKQDAGTGTQEKQQRVLTRMLDYSASLHKQDQSRQRKSTPGQDAARAAPGALPADLTEIEQAAFRNLSRDGYPVEFREVVEQYLQGLSKP